jgi:hypothetical protein
MYYQYKISCIGNTISYNYVNFNILSSIKSIVKNHLLSHFFLLSLIRSQKNATIPQKITPVISQYGTGKRIEN